MARRLSVSEAKATFLALAEEVATTGEEVVVTKRGKPLVKLSPVDSHGSLAGSVTFLVDEEELIYGRLDTWDMER